MLSITHWTQARRADCLAACAGMVLEHLGQPVKYDRLLRVLRIAPEYGTVANNIMLLAEFGVDVLYEQGTLDTLQRKACRRPPLHCLCPNRGPAVLGGRCGPRGGGYRFAR
ncbi:MAG: hypothetical protein HY784_06190 [Chloroflexi bacterium]|nr:hypothetical protein [Chloroflexota bacterium]